MRRRRRRRGTRQRLKISQDSIRFTFKFWSISNPQRNKHRLTGESCFRSGECRGLRLLVISFMGKEFTLLPLFLSLTILAICNRMTTAMKVVIYKHSLQVEMITASLESKFWNNIRNWRSHFKESSWIVLHTT